MEEWFYVKNDLKAREDIKEVIMRPIWSRFGLRRPKVEIDDATEACQKAFSTVCSFIGTRDLIQKHIAYRVWPLVESWEMPKETITNSSEGGLVWLKYTFRFGDKFDEPNNDWLRCIEATSDELLGAYSKTEDNALSAAFGGRNKKRLNRVFDAIGFVYPDYRYPLRGQGVKIKMSVSGKVTASAITAELKGKKMKVLTHRPRYIEPAVISEFGEGASSADKTKEIVPPAQRTEEPAILPKLPPVEPAETKADKDKAKGSKIEKITKMPEILSPSTEITVPKEQKGSAATPKRRMENVLDVVLETTKSLSPAPSRKIAKASKVQPKAETKQAEVKAAKIQAKTEAGPSEPTETEPTVVEEKVTEQIASERVEAPASEASKESIDYIIRHASGKGLSQEEKLETLHYAQKLKYPKGALEFNGSGEEDFLYYLPDNKEISVCRCFEKSLGCVEKIKASFTNVGAYSNEDNLIRGDPEGVIEWISGEAEAFEEILSDREDVCAFSGARGISAILEKAGCDHVKTLAQAEAAFFVDDTKDPSAEASLMGGKFYNDIWVNGGREMAHEIMKKSKKRYS
jgi:hypothetical protein